MFSGVERWYQIVLELIDMVFDNIILLYWIYEKQVRREQEDKIFTKGVSRELKTCLMLFLLYVARIDSYDVVPNHCDHSKNAERVGNGEKGLVGNHVRCRRS